MGLAADADLRFTPPPRLPGSPAQPHRREFAATLTAVFESRRVAMNAFGEE